MKQKLLISLLLTSFMNLLGFSQDNSDILLINSKDIAESRYSDIKDSPYYFENFVKGNIISTSAQTYKDLELNYNAYPGDFEVRQDGKFIELDKNFYMRVEVLPEKNPGLDLEYPIIFQRGFNANWFNKFAVILHDGKKVKFVKDFTVEILERVIQDVNKTRTSKRFFADTSYNLIIEGELINIRLKKKKIFAALKNQSELEKYATDNNIDVETESGLSLLLTYYETL